MLKNLSFKQSKNLSTWLRKELLKKMKLVEILLEHSLQQIHITLQWRFLIKCLWVTKIINKNREWVLLNQQKYNRLFQQNKLEKRRNIKKKQRQASKKILLQHQQLKNSLIALRANQDRNIISCLYPYDNMY
jgi:hypothetical protein